MLRNATKLVDDQDVFLIQLAGSGQFNSRSQATNKVIKEGYKPKHQAQKRKHSVKLM